MKRIFAFAAALCLSIGLLTGCGNNAGESEVIRWELATHNTANTIYWQELVDFADAIRERTDGKLDISVRGGGELPFKGNEFLRVVSDNTIQMAEVPLGYVSGDISASIVPSWPMIAGTAEQLEKLLPALSDITNNEISEKNFNLEIMCSYGVPLQVFWGVGEPVTSVSQLKDLSIRVFSAESAEILSGMGATPVSMSASEVVPSIQRQVIDAAITGVTYADEAKWYDVCDWGYMLPLCGSVSHVIVNKDAMSALPADIQEIVRDEAETLRQRNVELADTSIDASLENLEKNGMVINYPTDEDVAYMEELAASYWDKWATEGGATVQEALDIARETLGY